MLPPNFSARHGYEFSGALHGKNTNLTITDSQRGQELRRSAQSLINNHTLPYLGEKTQGILA
jgi:hypothetical protein